MNSGILVRRSSRLLVVGSVVVVLGVAAWFAMVGFSSPRVASSGAAPVDVSSDWALEVVTNLSTTTPTLSLKQAGTSVSGRYASPALGEAPVTGSINGRDITFSFSADIAGQPQTVVYQGVLVTDDAMEGTVAFGSRARGSFTGKRQR